MPWEDEVPPPRVNPFCSTLALLLGDPILPRSARCPVPGASPCGAVFLRALARWGCWLASRLAARSLLEKKNKSLLSPDPAA